MIVVEAGPVVRPKDFVKEAGYTLAKYFWDAGIRTTTGGNVIMPTMQPRVLGGGSVFNSAICLRIPEFALTRWQREHGVTATTADLLPHFEAVERFMGVRPTQPEVQGRRNELFAEACARVGLTAEPTNRNEDGCRGSGECLSGCPTKAKKSTDLRGIPEIIAMGGAVYTSMNIDRLIVEDGRVRGAVGWIVDPMTGERGATVRIEARHATVLAAGALASPVIALRSGIAHAPIGAGLRFHPSTAMMGVFDEEILPWSGASQGMHCLDYLERGVKLESLWAIPSLLAFRFPGVGHDFKRALADYRNMASWDAWASGEDSVGRVKLGMGGGPSIRYTVGDGDMKRLQFAMVKLAEMFFAVGAKRVLHGIGGLPPELRKPADVDLVRNLTMSPRTMLIGSNHVFGGMTMGGDPRRHAVDNRGAVYGTKGLYVMDTGIFPASPGVNPMLTAMAFADKFGQEIAERGY